MIIKIMMILRIIYVFFTGFAQEATGFLIHNQVEVT